MCLIETKNLDGETDYKQKFVHFKLIEQFNISPHYKYKSTIGDQIKYLRALNSTLLYENPNSDIYRFEGNIIFVNIILTGKMLLN